MPAFSKEQLQASICRDSFADFVDTFWREIVPEKIIWNWHMKFLCYELQKLAQRIFKQENREHDLIINIPPGTSKSTICSIMLPAWMWCVDPTMRIICGSYAHSLSLDLSRKCRLVVQSDSYQRLFPDVALSEDQNTKGLYYTTKGGGRMAVSVGGSVTGFHAHMIVIDDPIDPQQAASPADLVSANNWMRETIPTRMVDKKITPTVLIMQRLHQNDPTGEWLDRANPGDVRHICLPAELPKDDAGEGRSAQAQVKPKSIRRYYKKGLLDAKRMPREVLKSFREKLGQYGYAAQFDQTPIPRGGGMFQVDKIIKIDPAVLPVMVKKIRYWDKAATKDGGTFTVGTLMGKDENGIFYWLDVVRGQWDSYTRETIMKNTAIKDGIRVKIGIEQEPGSGGKESVQASIKNLAGYRVEAKRPTGDKYERADPLAVQVNGGNVRMVIGPWNKDLIDELTYQPFSRYNDQMDSASGAFTMLAQPRRCIGGLWKV